MPLPSRSCFGTSTDKAAFNDRSPSGLRRVIVEAPTRHHHADGLRCTSRNNLIPATDGFVNTSLDPKPCGATAHRHPLCRAYRRFACLGQFDRLPITQGSPTDFTVGYKARAELNNYWCAAGRNVTEKLGLPDDTPVYRLSPPPRKLGQGITFMLHPAKSTAETSTSTSGDVQDGGLSASNAQSTQCNLNRFVCQ